MLFDDSQIERWLRFARPVGQGEVGGVLGTVGLLGGWSERMNTSDDNPLCVVYVITCDRDKYDEIGRVEGKDVDELRRKLEIRFKIEQRGADSKYAGMYFWLIPVSSVSEGFRMICYLWHTKLQRKKDLSAWGDGVEAFQWRQSGAETDRL